MNQRTGYSLSISAALVWALTSPGLKFLLDTYGMASLTLAFWRDAFIAVACLSVLALFRPQLLRIRPSDVRGLAFTGVVAIGIYHALWVGSVALNGAAIAIVLIYTFPAFVTLGSWLVYREPVRWQQMVAIAMALLGCALLVRVYDPAVLRLNWLGGVVGLATGMTHACYVLFNQRAVRAISPWTSLTYTMLFGTLALLAMVLASIAWQGSWAVASLGSTPAPWLVLLAVALGPTLGGYALFTAALRHIPGPLASLVVTLEIPAATLLAVWLLGERLAWPQLLGMALIGGAIFVPHLLRDRRARAPVEQPAAT